MHTATGQSELFARLVEIGGLSAHGEPGTPDPPETSHRPETLYDRHGVLVVRIGDVVVKAHQPDREYGRPFSERVALAGTLPQVLLGPLEAPPGLDGQTVAVVDGRTVTVSPYGEPVNPEGDLPWEDGARLLAALHTAPVPEGAPSWGRPQRVARVVSRLDGAGLVAEFSAAVVEIGRAFATLPSWVRGDGPPPGGRECLIHGDWHLGQMVRTRAGQWRLIDIEDLGVGDPAWDLARPAALYSAGVLAAEHWERFLGAYRATGGPAVPPDGDPWAVLDVPARSLAIQIAATCVKAAWEENRPLDGPEEALVDTCSRISRMRDRA